MNSLTVCGASPRGEVLPVVVDAHHHLWDLSAGRYPWLQDGYNADTFMGDYTALARDFQHAHYAEARRGVRVKATVHIEAERARDEQLAETRWLHQTAGLWGFPNAVVAHAWLDRPDSEDMLLAQLEFPLVRGIRCKPATTGRPDLAPPGGPGSMRDPRWQDGLALLDKHGLSLDLRVPYWHLAEAADVLAGFPGLRVALNHAGLPWDRSEDGLAHWRRGMAGLAALPNVTVKLSEFGVRGRPWDYASNARVVADVLAMFGPGRCMFGSNFPVASLRIGYAPLVGNLRRMLDGLDEGQRDAVFHRNALDFYRIALTESAL
ncbi:Predicted metal-dependent hydrolase, TIM-barrel fold [Pseudoduganella namucuonensis]|uniref:Predicted metal-dependent hydrolase, TIM-barrel fold n=1 Tax=Pseudoduganella namucuonensis TaxID=1035707 RepID=A0A1I7LTD8_9BURK|nr:Predicted metal-dependent hydrolase, TIM-barrel fold [Pseudoduganella namucuonensis]